MGGMDWIELPQNMNGWRTLVYVVMNLRVPQYEVFLTR